MKRRSLEPSRRALRIGEEVRSVIMRIILNHEFKDEFINRDIISISEVCMSSDLQIATVYVSLPSDVSPDSVISSLNCNNKFIRRHVAKHLRNLKYVPDIRFRYDKSLQNYWNIDNLLRSPKVISDLVVSNVL
ncbi:30S ribosome-binding factor RbfA [Candidatus Liberibacter americanus]|nr:30S ribosome-binding factor RbfA [Candidatus Liberibacter americanus]EMS36491.1 ribosome-binding factor A [Candidatus Liberibacter americanus PW_SP]